jgi:hypothetical protein
MPDLLVAIKPEDGSVVQFGDRRLRVTAPSPAGAPVDIWSLTHRCLQLVRRRSVIAYGYNIDVGVLFDEATQEKDLRFLFKSDLEKIENMVGMTITGFIPRMIFQNGPIRMDVNMEALSGGRVKAHANFNIVSDTVPDEEKLGQEFLEQCNVLNNFVAKLFTVTS